jgi:hypothetical protein
MVKSVKFEVPHLRPRSLLIDPKRSTVVQSLLFSAVAIIVVIFVVLLLRFFMNKQDSPQNTLVKSTVASTISSSTNPLLPSKPYYGVNVDMSQLVPGSSNYYKNSKGQDYIDIAHHLGINLFRIDNITEGFNNGSLYTTYTQDQWNEVLNKMQMNGIKAVILIEALSSDQNLFTTEINQSYLNLVQQYIIDSNVGNNADVIGIDLKNEPALDSNNLLYLQRARDMIKQKYPNMPLCVGGWKVDSGKKDANGNIIYNYHSPADAPKLEPIVDFYCVHLYGFDIPNSLGQYPNPTNRAVSYLQAIALNTDNKPILLEEFGASNGTTITDQQTLGSMKLQANAYSGVYQAILNSPDLHIMGSTAYLFGQRGESPDSWAIMSKDGNDLNPAAYILQKYATGTSDVPVNLSSPFPNPHIYKNIDNGQTQTVNVGDPIGFILNLPQSSQYKAVISSTNLVTLTEPLVYDSSYKTYNLVYQAIGKGNVVFTVYNDPTCTQENTACNGNIVYMMALHIQ